jgi:hypothetical protein
VIVRVWVIRAQLGSALDAGLLIFFESARALTTLLAMLLIAAVVRRGSATVGARAFALLLAFLTIWYTKAFSFASFPGFAQEKVALWLLAEGVSRRLLAVVFGEPAWALWLALGAFVRVSVLFPQVLAAEAIERPESARRAGMMRSVAFAGADVGEAFRRLSGRALREGWLGPLPVWSVTVGAAAVHYVIGRNPIADAVLGLLFVCGLAVGITALRAGYVASVNVERQRIVWVAQAALTAVLSFMLAATLSAAVTSFAEWLSLGLMTVAPLFVLLGVATAVMPGEAGRPGSGPASAPHGHRGRLRPGDGSRHRGAPHGQDPPGRNREHHLRLGWRDAPRGGVVLPGAGPELPDRVRPHRSRSEPCPLRMARLRRGLRS